jgi:hypothetical protein
VPQGTCQKMRGFCASTVHTLNTRLLFFVFYKILRGKCWFFFLLFIYPCCIIQIIQQFFKGVEAFLIQCKNTAVNTLVLCSETLEAKLQNIVIKSGTMKSCQHVKYCKYSEGLLPTFLKAGFRNRTNDISYCVQKRWQSHKTIPPVLRNVGPSEY